MSILRFLQVLHETHEFVLNSKSFSLLLFFFLGYHVYCLFKSVSNEKSTSWTSCTVFKLWSTSYISASLKKICFRYCRLQLFFYISYFPFLVFVGLHLSRQNHSDIFIFCLRHLILFFFQRTDEDRLESENANRFSIHLQLL